MERWQNCVAVVTGASSGIGEAIAKDLAVAGLRVVTLGRRKERLEENRSKLAEDVQSRVYPRQCDVSNEKCVQETFKWIEDTLGGVDILINNAGVSRSGNIVDMDIKLIDEVINTNVMGLIYCTRAAFKSMKERSFNGHVVHINSILGHNVLPILPNVSLNVYPPSKFAVTAINETFRNEFRNLGTRIKTTSISPGVVRTEIAPQALFDSLENILNPEDISQAVLFAISTPPHVQIDEITVRPVADKF